MVAFDTITVAGTAIALTGTVTLATLSPAGAHVKATMRVESAQIRWRADGTAPTASVGILADIGDVITLRGIEEIQNFKAIRTGAVSAALPVQFSTEGR